MTRRVTNAAIWDGSPRPRTRESTERRAPWGRDRLGLIGEMPDTSALQFRMPIPHRGRH
jgi:hypothetical protein